MLRSRRRRREEDMVVDKLKEIPLPIFRRRCCPTSPKPPQCGPEQIRWSDILDTESSSSSSSFAVGIVKHVYISLIMVFPSNNRKHLKNQIDSDYASGNSNQLCIKCRHDCRYKHRYKSRCESKYKYTYKYIYTNTNTIWYSKINCA